MLVCGSSLAFCMDVPWRLGKGTAGQRLLALLFHSLCCRWLSDCCPAQGNTAHDPGAQSRENVPYWNHVGNMASQSQSLCVPLLCGKDHGECLTKVFKQPLSFLVLSLLLWQHKRTTETTAERNDGACPVYMVGEGQSKVKNSSRLTPRTMFSPCTCLSSFPKVSISRIHLFTVTYTERNSTSQCLEERQVERVQTKKKPTASFSSVQVGM